MYVAFALDVTWDRGGNGSWEWCNTPSWKNEWIDDCNDMTCNVIHMYFAITQGVDVVS